MNFSCGLSLDHFSANEFLCPCCGTEKMHPVTLSKIQRLRHIYGKPMRVAEGGGYRCPQYANSEHSAHREGRAFDPIVEREDFYELIKLAQSLKFEGIGVKNKEGRWQLHLDDSVNIPGIRPRPWIWTY